MREKQYTGILDKIRVLKTDPLLIRFSLVGENKVINCLIANKKLAEKIMILENNIYNITATGYWNFHEQFVVKSIALNNPDETTRFVGLD